MTGLFDGLNDMVQQPLFLAGANLALGGGHQGMMQGLQMGGQYRKQQQQQRAVQSLFDDPEAAKSLGPMMPLLRAGGAEMLPHAAQFMAKQPEMQFAREKFGHEQQMDRARLAEQRRGHDLQSQQMKYQSPEHRLNLARQYGIDPASPEGKQFVATGNYTPRNPMEAEIVKMMQGGQPQPPAAMSPSPQMPGPRLIPQSFSGSDQPSMDDPNFIRTQSGSQPTPQAQTAPQMVNTPVGPMSREQAQRQAFGLALAGKGDAGNMLLQSNALGKEATNENDKKALTSIDQASRLDGIVQKFKPEYQTYEFTAQQGANGWLDSFNATRGIVSPEKRVQMAEYTQFRQDSMNNLSQYIKEVTGAAMGIQEEARIREGMPDPKKDSPTQFEAKLRNSVSTVKLSLARAQYLKANGYDDNTISTLAKQDKLGAIHSLDNMKSIIGQRLDAAATALKQQDPNITPQALQQQLRMIQRREFGI